jgi:O-antigen ligase
LSKHLIFVPFLLALLWSKSTRQWAVLGFVLSASFVLIASYAHAIYPFSWAQATILQDVNDHYIFRDHNSQNLMLTGLMLIMIWSYARRSATSFWNRLPSQARRIVFAATLVSMVFSCLFLSHGRSGHIAMLATLVYAVWHFCPPRWRRQLAAAALVLAVLTSAGLVYSNHGRYALIAQDIKRFQQGDLLNNSIGLRLEFWRNGMLVFQERPVVGWGTGMYRKKYCSYGATQVSCEQGSYNPHNQFVLLAAELGIVGIAAYLMFLGFLWRKAADLSPQGHYLSRSLLLMLLVHSLSDSSLFVASPAHIFLLLLAVSFSYTRQPPASN